MSDNDSQGYSEDNDGYYSDDFATASPSPRKEEGLNNNNKTTSHTKHSDQSSRSSSEHYSTDEERATVKRQSHSPLSSASSGHSSRSSRRNSSSCADSISSSRASSSVSPSHKSVPASSRSPSVLSTEKDGQENGDSEASPKRQTAARNTQPQKKKSKLVEEDVEPTVKRIARPIDEERLANLAKPKLRPNKPTTEEEKRLATLEVQRRVMEQQKAAHPRPPKGTKKQGGPRGSRGKRRSSTRRNSTGVKKDESSPSLVPGTLGAKVLSFNIESGIAVNAGDYGDAEKLLSQAYNLLQSENPVSEPSNEEIDADYQAENEREKQAKKAEGKSIGSDDDEEEDKYDREDRKKRIHKRNIETFQKQKDPLLAMTLNNLGCLMRRVHKPSKALLYLEACVRLEKSMGKPSAITLLNACVAAIETREFTQAQDLGKDALKLLNNTPVPPGREARVKLANIKTSVRYRIADAMFQEFKANVHTNVYEDDEVMFNDADGVSEAFQTALHSSAQEGGGDGSQTAFIRQESKKVREFLQDFRLKYGGDVPWTETKEGTPQTFRLPGGLAVPPRAAAAYCRSQEQMVTTGLKQSLKPRCKEELNGRPTHEFSYTGRTVAASQLHETDDKNGSGVKLPAIRYVNNVRSVYKTGEKVLPIKYHAPKKRASSPMRRTKPATARNDPLDANVVAVRATQSQAARRQSVAAHAGALHRGSDASTSARESRRNGSLSEADHPTVEITEASIRGIGVTTSEPKSPTTPTPNTTDGGVAKMGKGSNDSSRTTSPATTHHSDDADDDPKYSDDEDEEK